MKASSAHAAKFEFRGGEFRASRAMAGSFLLSDLVAGAYEHVLPDVANGRLLDLGCGEAPLRPLYRHGVGEVVFADVEVRDCTLSPFVRIDAGRELPFPDSSFDVVVLSDVLEHVDQPHVVLSNVARVLRPGGALIGNTPFLYWVHEQPNDFWRPTRYGLERGLASAGFDTVLVTVIGGSVEVLFDAVAKHVATVPVAGKWLGRVVGRLGSWWARSSVGRRLAAKTGEKYPLAHFFLASKSAERISK